MRNVLVYLIDTLRADHLKPFNAGTRGCALPVSINWSHLRQRGVHVRSHAGKSDQAQRGHAALVLLPWEHHAVTTEAVVLSEVRLLPELLQEKGLHTGAFIANGYVSDKFGFKQGFDSFRNYIREGRYSRAEFLAADVVEVARQAPAKLLLLFLYVHAIDPHVPYKLTRRVSPSTTRFPTMASWTSDDTALLEKIKAGQSNT